MTTTPTGYLPERREPILVYPADQTEALESVLAQMDEVAEALALGAIDRTEAARIGTLILVGAMPDVDWLGKTEPPPKPRRRS